MKEAQLCNFFGTLEFREQGLRKILDVWKNTVAAKKKIRGYFFSVWQTRICLQVLEAQILAAVRVATDDNMHQQYISFELFFML